jgi:type IV pilus assembly protein PilQ
LVQDGKRVDVKTDVKTAEPKPPAPEVEAQAPAPKAEARLTENKTYTGQRISLDFKDADIRNVFRLLAEVSGLNIIVTDDVRKRVTVRLVDVPWDQALDLLIDTNGLGREQTGNVVRISTAGQLKSEKDALAAAKQADENLEPLQTAYLSVNYAKVKDLEEKIKLALTPRGTIVSDERSNTIIVRDIKNGIEEANEIVSRLDTRTPQILIESNLIETTPTFSRSLGAELDFVLLRHNDPNRIFGFSSRNLAGAPFSGAPEPEVPPIPIPTSGLRFGTFQDRVGSLRNLNSFLTAAENEGNIKIISRPSVVTLNNVASTIQSLRILRVTLPSSTNIASGSGSAAGGAVATEEIPVGIILTVTPQVSSDGFVLMNIDVKSSSLGTRSDGAAIPDELSRQAISNVLVRDGETIVIGGIMKDSSQDAEEGVPYLKDIPILGWLFKNIRWQKDFEELVVFITPRIISGGSENLPTAEELWRQRLKETEGG